VWEPVGFPGNESFHAIPDEIHAICDPETMSQGAPRVDGFTAMFSTDTPICRTCYAAVRSNVDTDQGAEIMAAKTADKLDVNTDAGKAALESISANTERVKTLRTEGKAEAAAELATETDALIGRLSGTGVAGPKASARMALTDAKKTDLPSTEVATRPADTVAWQDAEGAQDIVNEAATKIAEGLQLSLKVADIARDIAAETIRVGVRLTHKGGPDLKLNSQASKNASRAMYEQALGNLPETFDSADALKKLIRSVEYQRTKARVDYIKSLDENPDEAARFAEAIAAAPEGTSPSDAVFEFFKVEKLSKYERDQIAWQEEQAKAKELEAASTSDASDDEGEGEGEEGAADDTAAEALAKAADKLTRAAKLAEGAFKTAGKLDDEGKAKLKEALNGLVAAIASEAAKL
jgi:hypothetical protein